VSVARQRRVVDVRRESDEESSRSRKVPGQATSVPRVSYARDVQIGTSSEGFVIDSCHVFEQKRREAAHRSLTVLKTHVSSYSVTEEKNCVVEAVSWLRIIGKFG
jgi:hypothetical protein